MARIGEDGRRLWRLARGIDDRSVSLERETKSISAETTFDEDVGDRDRTGATLLGLCEKVARRLKQAELATGGVTLKLRLPDFKLRTRARGVCRRRSSRRGCSRPRGACWRRSRRASATG